MPNQTPSRHTEKQRIQAQFTSIYPTRPRSDFFSALTLLVGRQEGHTACKKTEWWSAGVVVCLEQDADLHMAQLMPLPLTVSCFSEIQIGFTFLVPAHPGSPGQRATKRVRVPRSDSYNFLQSRLNMTFFHAKL